MPWPPARTTSMDDRIHFASLLRRELIAVADQRLVEVEHQEDWLIQRCVRLTRPDGSALETFATLTLVSGIKPPAVLSFSGVFAAHIPSGTEIEFLASGSDSVSPKG